MNGIFRVFPADPDQSAARIIVAKRENASPGAEIFIKIRLCRFCDKVADYAKTIEREAEKTLGAKGSWTQNTNSKNSVLRMSEKAEIQLKTGVRIEDIAF